MSRRRDLTIDEQPSFGTFSDRNSKIKTPHMHGDLEERHHFMQSTCMVVKEEAETEHDATYPQSPDDMHEK